MAILGVDQSTFGSVGRRFLAVVAIMLATSGLRAENCITQSQMKPADRESIAAAARALSSSVQTNDISGLRQRSVPEFAKDFTAMTSLVANTSAKIAAAPLDVDQIYLLDATNLKARADGTNPDAQFFCSLNNSIAEATFQFSSLPPGQYAFAHVVTQVPAQAGRSPWQLSYLLRRDSSSAWDMAGFYPKPLTASGHDGLWYWKQARDQVKMKHLWAGYLFYKAAETVLQPVGFIGSTHLDKLRKESSDSAPPALSSGIDADTPLVVKSPSGAEFRFTSFTTDDSIPGDKLYVVVHLAPDPVPDASAASAPGNAKPAPTPAPASPKDRSLAAMAALLAAYPELRSNFGGVWVFADAPGKSPFVTEQAMADIR